MSKVFNPLLKATTFGKIDLDPKTPRLPKPVPAPDPEETQAAQSRALQRRRRSGRTSTILTDGSNTLG